MENKVIICGSSLGDSMANFLRAINCIKSKDGYLERVWLIKVRSGKIWTLFSNFNYLLKGGRPPPPSPCEEGRGGARWGRGSQEAPTRLIRSAERCWVKGMGLQRSPYEAHQERRTWLGQKEGASKEPLRGSWETPSLSSQEVYGAPVDPLRGSSEAPKLEYPFRRRRWHQAQW